MVRVAAWYTWWGLASRSRIVDRAVRKAQGGKSTEGSERERFRPTRLCSLANTGPSSIVADFPARHNPVQETACENPAPAATKQAYTMIDLLPKILQEMVFARSGQAIIDNNLLYSILGERVDALGLLTQMTL